MEKKSVSCGGREAMKKDSGKLDPLFRSIINRIAEVLQSFTAKGAKVHIDDFYLDLISGYIREQELKI